MATRRKKNPATKAKANATSGAKKATRKSSKNPATPSYDTIAQRAWCIWKDNGCQAGQDEHNWFEAAAQLEAELVSC